MIIFVSGGIGDRICFLPALQKLYSTAVDQQKMLFGATDILSLFDLNKYNWHSLGIAPYSQQHVYNFNISHIHESYNYRIHPVEGSFRIVGMQWNGFPDTQIHCADEWTREYDYVIAPYSRDNARCFSYAFLHDLVSNLDSDNIALLGNTGDTHKFAHPKVIGEYNRPWNQVASILKKCKKKIITCDSAVNRLVQIMRLKNHILVAHDMVPIDWARSPDTFYTLYGNDSNWKVTEVLERC